MHKVIIGVKFEILASILEILVSTASSFKSELKHMFVIDLKPEIMDTVSNTSGLLGAGTYFAHASHYSHAYSCRLVR